MDSGLHTSISIFSSHAGQGKSHALLHKALMNGRNFIFISGEFTEKFFLQRLSSLSNSYHITPPSISLFKAAYTVEDVILYIEKYTLDDIYIDHPNFNMLPISKILDLLMSKNIFITKNTIRILDEQRKMREDYVWNNENIIKKYYVSRNGGVVNVFGHERYEIVLP